MGTLIAMCYPTELFLDIADHTYVKCAGTKAWGCWGGKTGGRELRRGNGSTARADAIAEPNERAGITCYLVNGVCHQAANRILLPANITVAGARGYSLSESIFGTYGRPRGALGLCNAPFDQHPGIDGDIPECNPTGPTSTPPSEPTTGSPSDTTAGATASQKTASDKREQTYLEKVRVSYGKIETTRRALAAPDLVEFQLEIFGYKIAYNLGEDFDAALTNKMLDIRRKMELSRIKSEEIYANKEMNLDEFVQGFNDQTKNFQMEMSNTLSREFYRQFFNSNPGEIIELADPEIVAKMQPPRPLEPKM